MQGFGPRGLRESRPLVASILVPAPREVTVIKIPILHPRSLIRRATARDDATAGLVLGIESVPDGLANGLLAGVNPIAGLYAYLFGAVGGALFT
ncbi:MAG: SulP family inorganic anion transporter [Acidimicrobiia bacterium]|nr:SulP family inorganic anion transporter [Acidimicrobiia bacterium]